MNLRSILGLAALAATMALAGTSAFVHAYPTKPIRIIVPFPPGGSADMVARTVGQRMSESMRQPVIVENRPGADTIIAMQLVATSPADGYTLGYVIGSALTMNPTLYSKLPYDPVKDFLPVTLLVNNPLALVVHPSVPAKTARELADLIKASPGKLLYGQANIVARVATEAFAAAAGGKMLEIGYKGSALLLPDLIHGRVQVAIEPVASIMPFVKDGKLRALAVTDARRSKAFPDLPTIAESGLPGFSFNNWHAILVPAGTPREVVRILQAEIHRAARAPEVMVKLEPHGIEVITGSPEELQERAAAEREHWAKQIKALGIKVE
jgi:tripartite-type tricarboxylate transporter receptor subunit TctC